MNRARTIEEFTRLFHTELKDHFPQGEIDAFVSLSLAEITVLSREEIRISQKQELKPEQAERLHSVIAELKTNKPIQYILGVTEFYGCKLRVNEHVLIPRQETEELVDLILKETPNSKLNILDIGTGSGCIAIALKKKLPGANVSAIDISEEALLIAKQNALLNQTKINFLQADILKVKDKVEVKEMHFNLIVSNPPYVRLSEMEKMDKNVVDNEPHLALFVNDNDPLLFYHVIADFSSQNLSQDGKLYFEINEALGQDVKKLLEEKGFKKVEVIKDMSGKDRIVKACKM